MRGYVARATRADARSSCFLSLTAVFGMVRLGGDPVLLFLPMDIQAKDVNEFRQRLGFNDPLLVQYGRFMAAPSAATSASRCATGATRSGLVLERLPATLLLAGTALALTLVVAVPLGVLTAVRRDTAGRPRRAPWPPCSARPCPASGSGSC